MKRLIGLAVALLILGFYGAWPAWTGWRIRTAFETNDAALLESKVDFPSVRQSLKEPVTAEIQRQIERLARDAGPFGALLAGQIKGDVPARLAESTINTVVTPAGVLRMVREGRDMRQAIERVMIEQLGRGGADAGGRRDGAGGLGGLAERIGERRRAGADAPPGDKAPSAAQAGPDPEPKKRPLGLANVKSFAVDGPLGFAVGIARDPAAAEPDVTARLRFTGGDWKIVGVVPRSLGSPGR